jgi:hypothetical protein
MNATQNQNELTIAEASEVRYAIDVQVSHFYREYVIECGRVSDDSTYAKALRAMVGHLTRAYGKIAGPDFDLDGWISSYDDRIMWFIQAGLAQTEK